MLAAVGRRFTCNICGASNDAMVDLENREQVTCASCRSCMRFRSVILALSRSLFGTELSLPEFPVLKQLRGLGISDSEIYSLRLAKHFSYANSFYHQAPKFDLGAPDETHFGIYDFVICSEVLEHVQAPVDRAFETLARLLKPSGVLILTVPYSLDDQTVEHFAEGAAAGLAQVGGKTVMVSRSGDGDYKVFDELVFHGGDGSTLERRLFSEADIRGKLAAHGLTNVELDGKNSEKFGVYFEGPCSLPIIASRQPFSLGVNGIAELIGQVASTRRTLEAVRQSRWIKLGRWLQLGPQLPVEDRE